MSSNPTLLWSIRLIAVMCIAEVLGMVGFSATAAFLPTFVEKWQLTNLEAGMLNAVFFFGYLISGPVLSICTDRWDPRPIYLGSLLLTISGNAGFALFTHHYWQALLFRTIAGMGLGGTYMPGLKALSDLLTGNAQVRAVSFYTSSFGLGTSLSFYICGVIGNRYDWRALFMVATVAAVAALVITWIILPSQPRQQRPEWKKILNPLPVLKNRHAIGYSMAYLFHNIELFGLRSWLVSFLVYHRSVQGLKVLPVQATTLAAFTTLLSMPASVIGNELAIRFGRQRVITLIMIISAIAAVMLGFSAMQPFWWVFVCCMFHGMMVTADSSPITSGAIAEAKPENKGTTMAVHTFLGFIGSLLGPVIFGAVLDMASGTHSSSAWGLGFSSLGVSVALGPICLWLLCRKQQHPNHQLPNNNLT